MHNMLPKIGNNWVIDHWHSDLGFRTQFEAINSFQIILSNNKGCILELAIGNFNQRDYVFNIFFHDSYGLKRDLNKLENSKEIGKYWRKLFWFFASIFCEEFED